MKSSSEPKILREIYAGFIRIHILYHTAKRPFYGQELKEELEEHGYRLSYGTLYPLLANLESEGYLERKDIILLAPSSDAKWNKESQTIRKMVSGRPAAYVLHNNY